MMIQLYSSSFCPPVSFKEFCETDVAILLLLELLEKEVFGVTFGEDDADADVFEFEFEDDEDEEFEEEEEKELDLFLDPLIEFRFWREFEVDDDGVEGFFIIMIEIGSVFS